MLHQEPPIAISRHEIRTNLEKIPIKIGQIDVNGRCNAKCWYCPVKYEGNPSDFAVSMLPSELDIILKKIRNSGLISKDFNFLYSCHYNEVLLYKYFEEMLDIFRKYKFATMILSNGTLLTPEKTDLILQNKDVIYGIVLNIPSFDTDDWAKKSGLPIVMHDTLLKNLDYLHLKYPAKIQINCATNKAVCLDGAVENSKEDAERIANSFKKRYPNFTITIQENLTDRAGKLSELGVLKCANSAKRNVIGCSHSSNQGGRIYGWLHINAKGDLFLCCDDFNMEYRFGNLLSSSLDEIWLSDNHIDTIQSAQINGICRSCRFRIED